METTSHSSKYKDKIARRYRLGGGKEFMSLSDKAAQDGASTPVPAPLLPDYFPKHSLKPSMIEARYNPPMKHEDLKLLNRFVNPRPERPRKKKDLPMKKYNHFAMNYWGWNR